MTDIEPRSGQWRGELVKVAERLEAKTKQRRWTARTDYLIERDLVLGAFAIRKLIESQPTTHNQHGFPVRRCAVTGPDEFDDGRRASLAVLQLCHEILHSVVFTLACGETADLFDGVYLSSAAHRDQFAYLVLASDFIALCTETGDRAR